MSCRIILAGGGTGGHIFPAIAIANALQKNRSDVEILFVGAKGKMEMEKVPQAGYPIEGITIAGFNRSSLIKNIGLPVQLVRSFFQVRQIVKRFRPQGVVGVGGYSSFPVLRYAQACSIPTFIHEANARPGRSNQLLAKRASKVFAGAAGLEKYFPADRTAFTGNPVRQSIVNSSATREEGLQFFGLNPALKTVLVTGGSLGAKGMNEAIAAQLSQLGENKVQLIWQTGKNFEATAQQFCSGKTGMWAGDFISRMELAYAAADVVVSRAGAMAIAELSVAGKPVIFVPYPYAAEDHQTLNAQYLVQQQAAQCIRDAEAKEKLVPALLALVHNEKACEQLGKQIRKLAITDADDRIAKKIYSTLGC